MRHLYALALLLGLAATTWGGPPQAPRPPQAPACGCRCNLGGACECGPAGCKCSPCACPACKGKAFTGGNVATREVYHSFAFPVTVNGVNYPAGTLFRGPLPAAPPVALPAAPIPATYPLPAYLPPFRGGVCVGGS